MQIGLQPFPANSHTTSASESLTLIEFQICHPRFQLLPHHAAPQAFRQATDLDIAARKYARLPIRPSSLPPIPIAHLVENDDDVPFIQAGVALRTRLGTGRAPTLGRSHHRRPDLTGQTNSVSVLASAIAPSLAMDRRGDRQTVSVPERRPRMVIRARNEH